MADCEAPSFSLGLDFLFDSEPQSQPEPTISKPRNDEVPDSDHEPETIRVLRRLRRGLPRPREATPLNKRDLDDDIEDFSSQDDFVEEPRPSTQYHSMCSSSKISLNGCGAIGKSLSEFKATKNKPASTSTETNHGKKLFAKSTVSPVRRFQLIDSDSDDPSTGEEDIITGCSKANQSSVKQRSSAGDFKSTDEKVRKGSERQMKIEDLWKNFTPIKSFKVPTPALDEMCEEYFSSVKDKKACEKPKNDTFAKSCSDYRKTTNETKISVPAHRYFLHDDPRIRNLVCDRLSNFVPLGFDDDDINSLHNGSTVIDYMGQFGNKDSSKRQATQQVDGNRNTKRGRNTVDSGQGKNSRKRGNNLAGESSHASQSWVDPKQVKKTPKSRARKVSKKGKNTPSVSAREGLNGSESWVDPRSSTGERGSLSNSQSGGKWFTGSNGRKVYVNKTGQELTGSMAYMQYKKDRGGNGKTKRKTGSKKKT